MRTRISVAALSLLALGLADWWGSDPSPGEAGLLFQITVNTTADEDLANSSCSLREAIVTANTNANYKGCAIGALGDDTHIVFDIGAGTPVINISSSLPTITDNTIIDGNTGGATRVQLLGDGGALDNGLNIQADDSIVANMVISGFGNVGILVGTAASNANLRSNFVGTNPSGTMAVPNGIGIFVSGTATIGGTSGWVPGGTCNGDCNLVSGNTDEGIGTHPSAPAFTTITGNMIGTDVTGTQPVPNGDGVRADGGDYRLGTAIPGGGNLIAGNTRCGLVSSAGGSTVGSVERNFFGTDTTGMISVPNFCGIDISDAPQAFIGGFTSASRNVIADGPAISIERSTAVDILGNYVGIAVDGTTPLGTNDFSAIFLRDVTNSFIGGFVADSRNVIANRSRGVVVAKSSAADSFGILIRNNSIYSNESGGISLSDSTNLGIQAPVITGFGSLHGTACANCLVDIYSDDEDEGRIYEGTVTADDSGNWTYNGSMTGPFMTATANDLTKGTSEFSAPFDPTPPTPTPSPTPSPPPTPTPTITPTPTATPTATPTPTTTPSVEIIWGDGDCGGAVTLGDAIGIARHLVSLPANQEGECPALGSDVTVGGVPRIWQDIDCSGGISLGDAIGIARFLVSLPVNKVDPQCPNIGDVEQVT